MGNLTHPRNAVGLARSVAPSGGATSPRIINWEDIVMLKWALICAIIAIIAAALGFTGVAGAAAGVAKFLFFAFLVLFVITLIAGLAAGRKVKDTIDRRM